MDGSEPRGHVRMTREFGVKRLESAPRAEQQRRGFAAKARGPGDVTADEVRTCSLGLVKRAVLRAGNEPEGSIERPSLEANQRLLLSDLGEQRQRGNPPLCCVNDPPLGAYGCVAPVEVPGSCLDRLTTCW